MISTDQAITAISTAEAIAFNSDSNDEELGLLSAFFNSAVRHVPEDKLGELLKALEQDLDKVLADPGESQCADVESFKSFLESIEPVS
ncbi:MAG: hypothetical protein C9356_12005 [Oleiphilus sp.]|nr:MAG: hypothetical protein C9356_12005 [Oleiphilus sp.]